MSVANATPEELKRLDNFVLLQRSTCVLLWQLDKAITAIVQDWNSDILGIIGSPQGTTIVDSNNYPGAVPLTDTQVTNLFGILQTLQTNTFTAANEDLFLRATGPNNMV
jgi:hypothetical protein